MKKTIFLLLFFSFISNEKNYAQSIDIGNYYLISQSPLSTERKAQIESITKDFSIALQTNLTVKGYTTMNDPTPRRYNTQLYRHNVNFNPNAKQVIFMRVLYDDSERLSIISYLCEVSHESGTPIIEPLRAHTSSGHINLWSDTNEKTESLQATTKGLFQDPSIDGFSADESFLDLEKSYFSGTPADDTLYIPQTPRLTTTNIRE